jgi:hypothetical protein
LLHVVEGEGFGLVHSSSGPVQCLISLSKISFVKSFIRCG